MGQKPNLVLSVPSPEFEKILAQTSKPALKNVAHEVSDSINAPTNVSVFNNEQGRAVAMVTVVHPKGMAMQAKHGALTRAAAKAGLDVKRYRV